MISKLAILIAPSCLLLTGLAPEARALETAAYSKFASCLAAFQPKPYSLWAWTQGTTDAQCFATINAINKYMNESGCSGGFRCMSYKEFEVYNPFYSTTGRAVTVPHPSGVCQNPDGEWAGVSLQTTVDSKGVLYNYIVPVPLGKNPTARAVAERMAQNVGAPFAAYHGERYGNGTVATVMAEPGTAPFLDGGTVGAPLPKGLGEVVVASNGAVHVVQRLNGDKKVGPLNLGGSATSFMPYGNAAVVIGAEEATKKVRGLSKTLEVLLPFAAGNSIPEGHATYSVNDHLTLGAKTFATVVLPKVYEGIQTPRAFAQFDYKKSGLLLSAYADSHGLADIHLQKGPFSGTLGEDHGELPFRLTSDLRLPKWLPLKGQVFAGRAPGMVNLDFGDQAHNLVNPYDHAMQYPDSKYRPENPKGYVGFHLELRKPASQPKPKRLKAPDVQAAQESVDAAPQSGSAAGAPPAPAPND